MAVDDREIESYLARIRKTIADSESLVSQAELRIAETDRLLEQQGLSREQVMAMRFTDAQIEAANEELRRRGMDPLEKWTAAGAASSDGRMVGSSDGRMVGSSDGQMVGSSDGRMVGWSDGQMASELSERQRKFGMMMKPFQI